MVVAVSPQFFDVSGDLLLSQVFYGDLLDLRSRLPQQAGQIPSRSNLMEITCAFTQKRGEGEMTRQRFGAWQSPAALDLETQPMKSAEKRHGSAALQNAPKRCRVFRHPFGFRPA